MSEHKDTPETRTHAGAAVAPIAAAQSLGRYQILSVAGTGGMGRVYAAFDPQLDRRVALKVVHTKEDASHQQRASREAKALARLSHPNVVAIHEVTEHDGELLIAMEFVTGQTLKAWMVEHTPSGKRQWLLDALDVLIQAGRGLAAAHEAKLVHRDFKPSNVLVGDDGRVRVVDFGLARDVLAKVGAKDASETAPSGGSSSGQITKTGAVVGTPAYMAPEQTAGEQLDGRTDQYAFCVAAWEVLFGARPGRDEERVKDAAVPGGVEKALRKGLSKAPGGRFANMEGLLRRLESEREVLAGRRPARRRLALAGLAVVAVSGVFGGQRLLVEREVAACQAQADVLDESWNAEVAEEITTRLESTRLGAAAPVGERSSALLSDYANQWRENFEQACESSIRDDWPAEHHDAALWCLDDRRTSFSSLVSLLKEADNDAAIYAVQASSSLADPSECLEPERLDRQPPPAAERDELVGIREDVAAAESLYVLGDYAGSKDKAVEAVTAADKLGWFPSVARARLALAHAEDEQDSTETSLAEARSAMRAAIRGALGASPGAQRYSLLRQSG